MKLRGVQRLISRYVAPSFPELQLSRDLLVRWDGDPIVRGFVFDRSQMNNDIVRLDAFAQPLFVPVEYVSLGVAKTLGDFLFDDRANEPEVTAQMLARAEREGRLFLETVSDCASLADTVLKMPGDRIDPRLGGEIRAYCLLWTGRTDAAIAQLDDLIEQLRDFQVEYELELLDRVKRVRQALERSEDEARELLRSWSAQTAKALGLEPR